MAIFTIAPVNSLSFVRVNTLLENFDNTLHHELTGVLNKEPYHQRVITGETITLQIKNDYDTITAQVYNILTNTYTSLIVTLAATFSTFSFHEVAFTVASAGFYKVYITGTKAGYSSVNLVSELIESRASWEGVKLVYYNSSNTSYVDYATGLTHLLRVPGTVRFSDVGGKDEFYNNLGSEERIYSENETIDELTIEAIPYYLAKKIIYGSRLDTFKVNDLEYVVKEHSVSQHNGSHSFDLTLKLTQKSVYGINDDFEPTALQTNIVYGALYNWHAVNTGMLAASGWGVPTHDDRDTLITYLGGTTVAGVKLKEIGFTYWNSPNTGATNEVGFNARGGGFRGGQTGGYGGMNIWQFLWCLDAYDAINGYSIQLYNDLAWASASWSQPLSGGYSIRLVRAATEAEQLLADGTACDDYVGNDGKIYPTVKIGTQVWTAVNLSETKYRNGDAIPKVTDNSAWAALTTGAMCYYDNDESNAFTETEVPGGSGSTTADSTTPTADNTTVTADGT